MTAGGSVHGRRKGGPATGAVPATAACLAIVLACMWAGALAGPAAARETGPAASREAGWAARPAGEGTAALAAGPAASSSAGSAGSVRATCAVAPAPVRAAMVADIAGLGDHGFNHLCYFGLQRAAAELGAQIAALESKTAADYATHLGTLAAQGYSPVFAVGYRMTDAVTQLAPACPGTVLAGIDSVFGGAARNVVGLSFKEQEAAYLAGVVAGMLTTRTEVDRRLNARQVVGFVGGVKIPPVERFQTGFKAGVRSVAPRVTVRSLYTRSFTDEVRGRRAALKLIRGGADIVFAAAGSEGAGAAAACKSRGALFIGVDADQYETIPGLGDTIVTSAVKRVDTVVFLTVQDAAAGRLQGGVDRVFGLAEGGVGLAPFHGWDKKLPADIKRAVARATAAVIAGDVVVPQ